MDEQELLATAADISDRLIPERQLDTFEQALYWYLFRETHLRAAREATVSYAAIRKAIGVTKTAATRRLRSLQEKGCIKLVDTGWGGTKVSVSLPAEVLGTGAPAADAVQVDIETINFFSDSQYREAILRREASACFYCLRKLTRENNALDHLVPQRDGGNDTYRNVVAACHSCNSSKNAISAEDFIRGLYRSGRLSDTELDQRLLAVEAVKQGELKPDV
jgi:DNA-binding Lrp family transcriptional regulator